MNTNICTWTYRKVIGSIRKICLQKDIKIHEIHTSSGDDLFRVLKQWQKPLHAVLCPGGDGTIHSVVHACMSLLYEGCHVPSIWYVPAGRGNDFGRSLKLHEKNILNSRESIGKIDVLEIEVTTDGTRKQKIWGINVGGAGYDGYVVRIMKKMPWILQKWKGIYTLASLKALTQYQTHHFTLLTDNQEYSFQCPLVVFANGSFFGGGMKIVPDAKINDGMIDILWGESIGRIQLLLLFMKVFRGTHIRDQSIRIRKTREFILHCTPRAPVEVDGEHIGWTPIHVKCIPHVLNIRLFHIVHE